MFHHRLSLAGTDDALIAAGAELVAMGATPLGPGSFITSRPGGAEAWRSFAEDHPALRTSIEVFQEFEDEFVQAIVTTRGVSELSRRSVLPEDLGASGEGGRLLPRQLLGAAGRAVAAERLVHDVGTLSSPLDDALTLGKALGRFCESVEPRVFGDPREEDLAAVREVAVFAWRISVAPQRNGTPPELEFDHALALTQAVVQAGREELPEEPGRACWMSWAEAIVAGAAATIELGTAGEHATDEHLSFAAMSLLTTCIQTLALFSTDP